MTTRHICFLPLLAGALLLGGCGASRDAATIPLEERFAHARALYEDGDYLEAINEFTVITLQFQGSPLADDAQYYLGESRFAREEYLLAVFEYQQLIRNMPASPLVADAQLRIGTAYFRLAPTAALDQQYTKKAIDELQAFIEYNPTHARVPEAEDMIRTLTTRLAQKSFEIARQYARLDYTRAALFYFNDVIEKFHDTEFAPQAYLRKTELLMDRGRYPEADAAVREFIERHPNSVLRGEADRLRARIARELPSSSLNSGGRP